MATINTAGKGPALYNAIRSGMSETSKNLLPIGTADNIGDIANIFMRNPNTVNEFTQTMSNKVTDTYIHSPSFKSPLSELKKNTAQLGDTLEEVYIGLVAEHVYNPVKAESEVFQTEKPNIKASYTVRNRQSMYKVTVNQAELFSGFQSWTAFENLIGKIVNTLVTSNQRDEFNYVKQVPKVAYDNKHMSLVEVGDISTKDGLENLTVALRQASLDLGFINTRTPLKVEQTSEIDEQLILITTDVEAATSVKVLSAAFNMTNAEYLARRILVDDLGDKNIKAVLVNKNFFIVQEQLFQAGVINNPQGLYDNHFLHVWQTIGYSLFNNAVAFVEKIEADKNQYFEVDHGVVMLGSYGSNSVTTNFEFKQYKDTANKWKFEATTDNEGVTAEVTADGIEGTVKITIDPTKVEPNGEYHVTLKATAVDDAGAVLPDAPTAEFKYIVNISMYLNLD